MVRNNVTCVLNPFFPVPGTDGGVYMIFYCLYLALMAVYLILFSRSMMKEARHGSPEGCFTPIILAKVRSRSDRISKLTYIHISVPHFSGNPK